MKNGSTTPVLSSAAPPIFPSDTNENQPPILTNENEIPNPRILNGDPHWEDLVESSQELLPIKPLSDSNGDMSQDSKEKDKDKDDDDDDDVDDNNELTDNPVSMTVKQLAPLSSISEVTLDKLDLGELQPLTKNIDI